MRENFKQSWKFHLINQKIQAPRIQLNFNPFRISSNHSMFHTFFRTFLRKFSHANLHAQIFAPRMKTVRKPKVVRETKWIKNNSSTGVNNNPVTVVTSDPQSLAQTVCGILYAPVIFLVTMSFRSFEFVLWKCLFIIRVDINFGWQFTVKNHVLTIYA